MKEIIINEKPKYKVGDIVKVKIQLDPKKPLWTELIIKEVQERPTWLWYRWWKYVYEMTNWWYYNEWEI